MTSKSQSSCEFAIGPEWLKPYEVPGGAAPDNFNLRLALKDYFTRVRALGEGAAGDLERHEPTADQSQTTWRILLDLTAEMAAFAERHDYECPEIGATGGRK